MAATFSSLSSSPSTAVHLTFATKISSSARGRSSVKYVAVGMSSFGGLKAQNRLAMLGLPTATEESFAIIMKYSTGGRRGGGALSSTCNAADEIFKIAAIMNGLVLVGVAVGFVLLRIEAFVEESENE